MGQEEIEAVAGFTEGVVRVLVDQLRRLHKKQVAGLGLPARNPNFTGREEQLKALHQALVSGRATAIPLVISGLGGIGKTHLTTEYCYRHLSDYSVIWWLRAEVPATLADDYAALAVRLGLPEKDAEDQRLAVGVVRAWLKQNEGWLLVFDNAPNPAGIRDYLPSACSGSVVITSRYQTWGGVASELPLLTLPRPESVEFILRRTRTEDKVVADKLADALSDLPLALEQAAAYVVETSGTIAHYLELLTTSRKEALSWHSRDAEYPDSVATTWAVSFRALEKETKVGAALLKLAAFLAPDKIPLDLLFTDKAKLPPELAPAATKPMQLDRAKAALMRLSLAQFQGNDMTVHRLVQAVARDQMRRKEESWAKVAVVLLDSVFPFDSDEVRSWPECARLLGHALTAAANAESVETGVEQAARILDMAGRYLRSHAQFAEAEPLHKRSLAIREKALGPNHRSVAASLDALAELYRAQGRHMQAEPLYRRSLAIFEKTLGPGDPQVAASLNNLAVLYRAQGEYALAEPLYRRSLAIWEKAFGPDHPDVSTSLNNLAALHYTRGQYALAEPLYKRSLAISEKAFGPDHPNAAMSLNNLAELYRAQRQYAQAEPLYKRSLAIWEKALGPDHPDVATSLNNLGKLYYAQGQYARAEPLLKRALATREKILGPDHPQVAASLNNLAESYRAQGQYAQAEPLLKRALAIWEKALGPDHPDVTTSLNNLGKLYYAQGQYAQAEPLLKRALATREKILGPDHPHVGTSLENLAKLLRATNRAEEADALDQRVARIRAISR